jgi:hypothetical protein
LIYLVSSKILPCLLYEGYLHTPDFYLAYSSHFSLYSQFTPVKILSFATRRHPVSIQKFCDQSGFIHMVKSFRTHFFKIFDANGKLYCTFQVLRSLSLLLLWRKFLFQAFPGEYYEITFLYKTGENLYNNTRKCRSRTGGIVR